jgi:hypothetical protein
MMMEARMLLLLLVVVGVHGFASWLASDYCDRPLTVDTIIMNNAVYMATERVVMVQRGSYNGKELSNGDEYQPGETLFVTLSDYRGQFVFEAKGAELRGGGCDGRRSTKRKVEMVMPDNSPEPVQVWAGWATGQGAVAITPVVTLMSPHALMPVTGPRAPRTAKESRKVIASKISEAEKKQRKPFIAMAQRSQITKDALNQKGKRNGKTRGAPSRRHEDDDADDDDDDNEMSASQGATIRHFRKHDIASDPPNTIWSVVGVAVILSVIAGSVFAVTRKGKQRMH